MMLKKNLNSYGAGEDNFLTLPFPTVESFSCLDGWVSLFQVCRVIDGIFVSSCSLDEIRTAQDKYKHKMSKRQAGCFAEGVSGMAP